jgi:ABC-2 type transport system ATP-binding protein
MSMPKILVCDLSKTYRVPVREAGLRASARSLLVRTYRDVMAVQAVNFQIEMGEIIGFLGPNGAGKTTTLKMLSGLLYPTSGEVYVSGFIPWKREPAYLRTISMVMGNKSQLSWDIPPRDSFHIVAEIYRVPRAEWQRTLDELVDLLVLEPLLTKPVRQLSLGERMKCELVAALLYRPSVLFLDEPTLGLDVSMQARLRRFVAEYNQRTGATIILTSHYMADVVALCPRVIVINHGQLLFDGTLQALTKRFAPSRLIRLVLDEAQSAHVSPSLFPAEVEIIKQEQSTWTLSVSQEAVPRVTSQLLLTLPVVDLAIEEPPIETVIEQVYQTTPNEPALLPEGRY